MNPSYLPGGANVHPLLNALFSGTHYAAYLGTYGLHGTGSRTWGDSDVISMPAGFRRLLVGKTLTNVFFHCDSAEIRFVGKLVIIQTFS